MQYQTAQNCQTQNYQTMQTPSQSINGPVKVVFLLAMLGVTSYFLVKISRALVTELEK